MKPLLLLIVLILSVACGGRSTDRAADEGAQVTRHRREFSPVQPPAMLSNAQKGRYVALRYWDGFDFADTLSPGLEEMSERVFTDFVDLLRTAPLSLADSAVRELMVRASANRVMFDRFAALGEKYLYDPNSPFRNDELFIPVLESMLASPYLNPDERIRPESLLALARRNRLGEVAADFSYVTIGGGSGHLHGIRADYLLLFFNNPDCASCKELSAEIAASPMLSEMIEKGTLRVLALYPDEQADAWVRYASNVPASWINARDAAQAIRRDELYDLKAIPSLYLLDARKRVMLKDCSSVPQIEEVLYLCERHTTNPQIR